MQQLEITFQTTSPINAEKLSKQNRQVYEHLAAGRTITLLIAEHLYGIRHLHSRISDLRNISHLQIFGREITAVDRNQTLVKCKEYSLTPFIN